MTPLQALSELRDGNTWERVQESKRLFEDSNTGGIVLLFDSSSNSIPPHLIAGLLPYVEHCKKFDKEVGATHQHDVGVHAAKVQFGMHSACQGGANNNLTIDDRSQHIILLDSSPDAGRVGEMAATKESFLNSNVVAR